MTAAQLQINLSLVDMLIINVEKMCAKLVWAKDILTKSMAACQKELPLYNNHMDSSFWHATLMTCLHFLACTAFHI